jgi:hypothetical protein
VCIVLSWSQCRSGVRAPLVAARFYTSLPLADCWRALVLQHILLPATAAGPCLPPLHRHVTSPASDIWTALHDMHTRNKPWKSCLLFVHIRQLFGKRSWDRGYWACAKWLRYRPGQGVRPPLQSMLLVVLPIPVWRQRRKPHALAVWRQGRGRGEARRLLLLLLVRLVLLVRRRRRWRG